MKSFLSSFLFTQVHKKLKYIWRKTEAGKRCYGRIVKFQKNESIFLKKSKKMQTEKIKHGIKRKLNIPSLSSPCKKITFSFFSTQYESLKILNSVIKSECMWRLIAGVPPNRQVKLTASLQRLYKINKERTFDVLSCAFRLYIVWKRYYWILFEKAQINLCAPNGKGRTTDLKSFESFNSSL